MCITAFRLCSSPSKSLVILFIHLAFPLCYFGFHIFSKILFFIFHPIVGMFSHNLLPGVGRIFFRCFGISCFYCIVLPFVDISLISLLSPVLSGLFPQVVLLFFLALPFPFCSYKLSVFLFYHFGLFS